jgi:Reverse transcriptase (RNA-dependent DNA polymerase)/RNase H-like domain found in reverse transcriptase
MVDSGATGLGFIDSTYARTHGLKTKRLPKRINLYGFDGSRSIAGSIRRHISLDLEYNGHLEKIFLYVTTLGSHDVILGLPWMKKHEIIPDWKNKKLLPTAEACSEHFRTPKVRFNQTPEYDSDSETRFPTRSKPTRSIIKPTRPTPKRPVSEARSKSRSTSNSDSDPDSAPFKVYAIGAAPFCRLSRKHEHEIFAVSLRDIEKALEVKEETDPATKLPPEYHDLLDVFSRKEANKLPPHRSYDHRIQLELEKTPPYGPLYGMSRNQLEVLRDYLKTNLDKGFIRASSSPAASPVIFVKKPGGGLRFCVDYRGLNALTVKNRYPIPLIQETLDRLSRARVYTKLDIVAAFNRLRIAKGDEWMTAFRTRYGLFEYLVMPFGLANAPSSFQHYVNDVLRPFLDLFATAYIDDILIYSNSLSEHRKHVRQVLEALREAGLQLDIDKCEFHQTEVLYLGLVITTDGIRMDPKKIEAILAWQEPKNVKDVRAFIGFANFYRRFIDLFSTIVAPLISLTKKDVPFRFDSACRLAFEKLKKAFTSAPVLRHFDPDLPCVVEADSSDYATGGVLS